MSKHDPASTGAAPKQPGGEGEGNYTATRRYNEHLKEHIQNEDIEEEARRAKTALEGDEGAALREAERRAKRGPAKH
jgi:hypothetical protein